MTTDKKLFKPDPSGLLFERNGNHDYNTRVRLHLNSKLDYVPSQGRVELSQLGASERYTGMAPSKL